MRKLIFTALIFAACALPAWAQGSNINQDGEEYSKASFFAGYSFNRPDVACGDSPNLNGFDAQATGYINKYFGIKGDVSGHYGSETFQTFCVQAPCPNVKARTQFYNFLAGPEVRARNRSRVTPFAHGLAGAAYLRRNVSFGSLPDSTNDSVRFALALGGGLDVRVNDHLDVRVIQVDYNPVFFDGSVAHGARVSVGLVFK